MPILTRRVQVARAAATTSGDASTERSFWKWISASHTASKPRSSAAFICAIDSSNAAASLIPAGHWNSVNRPNSIPPPPGFANPFILRHSGRAARMEMTRVVGSIREVQRMPGKICLAVTGIGLGLISLTAPACETASGRLAPTTSTTSLMAGWERKFTLDWTVEPEPNNARRIRGYISSQYGQNVEPVRILALALDPSGGV